MTLQLETATPAQTRRIGERIGRRLQAGDAILLSGDLGAGKTVIAQGIGRGLGVTDPIKSSSFVIMNEYQGTSLRMFHADLYRLEDPAQVAELALEELASRGVLVIEWPERALDELPEDHLRIHLTYASAKTRTVEITSNGARWNSIVLQLERLKP